ncbi:MAG: hypothetical protein MZV64_11490 [Ignavibacteriales bacterium]|nr:hypothetical protein [Ignavibacteriales bacterium]MCK7518292.1 hypothetical protein [Ignavibacteriales bacterium]
MRSPGSDQAGPPPGEVPCPGAQGEVPPRERCLFRIPLPLLQPRLGPATGDHQRPS